MTEIPQTSDLHEKPGRETASAFDIDREDVDGGLLERYRYSLTRADALAFLQLKREWRGWAKWALGAWFIAGGAVSGITLDILQIPDGTAASWAVFLGIAAVQMLLVMLAINLRAHWQAARLVPKPIAALFEIRGDCIVGTDLASKENAYLSHELIGQVLDTPTHLFILNFATVIVVPRPVFGDAAEAAAIANHLRKLAEGPYYFDPHD